MATVAVAAVVGFGGVAAGQTSGGGEHNKSTSGSMQEQNGGGMSHSTKEPSGHSAQSKENGGKQNERLGQGATQEQKGMTRSTQGEQHGMEQKGAQGENQKGAQEEKNQKGAQEERGTNVKGAQQRGAQKERPNAQEQRGAQRQPSTTERGTTEQGQAGVTGGGRGGSVQLSEQQRTKIKTIVTGEHAARFSGNVNFDVRVGTKIPRSVHIAALPDDIVGVVPEYRGYDYVLVRDEILIVEPVSEFRRRSAFGEVGLPLECARVGNLGRNYAVTDVRPQVAFLKVEPRAARP